MFLHDPATVSPTEIYTRKYIIIMETSISYFHTSLYIPEIKKLAFHLPHARILWNNHCGNTQCEALKRRRENQYVLCCCDYAERAVASFAHQIQYEYYGLNKYVYIEVIELEQFNAPTQTESEEIPQALTSHYVFHLFLSDDIKKCDVTTISHSKCIMTLLKKCNILAATLITLS